MGGTLFAFFAACYYWIPKWTGRTFNELLGQAHFWTMWLGFNGTFITLAVAGLLGMPRRVPYYLPYLHTVNFIASVFAFILGAPIFPFLANLVYGVVWGPQVDENPWQSRSLEWHDITPPPIENFDDIPRDRRGPYDTAKLRRGRWPYLSPSRAATGVAGAD